jgi:predicted hotdog family 3-hydroxylacyl-ACP dehydratase
VSRTNRRAMADRSYPAVAEVVPHSGAMVLLTRVDDHVEHQTTCLVEIGEDTCFRQPGGLVPAWVGLEYMAQCVAVHAGLRARANGEPVKIGLLLGSKRIDFRTAAFSPGQVLEVKARRLWGDKNLGSFACSVVDAGSGTPLVEGTLSVLLAEDVGTLAEEPTK